MTELFLPMLIMSDPPRHTQLRHLVSKAFTPRRIAGLEAHIQTLVDDLLDQTPETGAWDFVSGFAGPLPGHRHRRHARRPTRRPRPVPDLVHHPDPVQPHPRRVRRRPGRRRSALRVLLHVPRRTTRAPPRRPHDSARPRRSGRRTPQRGRTPRLLPAAARRRARNHHQPALQQRRHPRPTPRKPTAAGRQPRTRAGRGRGAAPLRLPGPGPCAHPDPTRSTCTGNAWKPATPCCCSSARPTATTTRSPTPTTSTSTVHPNDRSRSDAASTSASAQPWPASKHASPCKHSSTRRPSDWDVDLDSASPTPLRPDPRLRLTARAVGQPHHRHPPVQGRSTHEGPTRSRAAPASSTR